MSDSHEPEHASKYLNQQHLLTIWLIILIVLLLMLTWVASNLILLIFLASLVAIFLRSLSDGLARITKWNPQLSLLLVILLLFSVGSLGIGLFAADVADQVGELSQTLPQAIRQLQARIEQSDLGSRILSFFSNGGTASFQPEGMLTKASKFASSTFGVIGTGFVVLFIGFYLAFSPRLYIDGLLSLIPKKKQSRASQIIQEIGKTLRWWLIGKTISMVAIGVMIVIGLSLLKIPLALGLGTLAGLLSFIPNIGPILAALPAILLAFTQSPILALYVTLLYIGVQVIEGNILTPYIEKQTVSLPPALTMITQILFGILFGFLGLLLAAPLTAACVVLIKMLYVEDFLGQSTQISQHIHSK